MALPQAIDIRISMLRLAPQCFAFTSYIHGGARGLVNQCGECGEFVGGRATMLSS